jgi:hypothetical protein
MNTSASSSSASSSASSNSPSHLSPTSNTSNFFQPTTSSSPLNVVTSVYPTHAAYWPAVNSYSTSSSQQATMQSIHSNQHYSNYATAAAVAAAAQQYPNTFHSLNVASPQNQTQYGDIKYSPTTSVPFLYGIESCGGILNQLAVRNTNSLLSGSTMKQTNNSNIDESVNQNDSGFLSNDSPTNSNTNNNNTNTDTVTGNTTSSNNNNSTNNNNNNSNNTSATLTSSWNNGC